MSHITPEQRARAAETKRRRTTMSLVNAADKVLADRGLAATIEDIAAEARVSVATFYNYFTSRNQVCVDAFTVLVVQEFEAAVEPLFWVDERLAVLAELVEGRESLIRAALIGRLEEESSYDFVGRLAQALHPIADPNIEQERMRPEFFPALHALALELLDGILNGSSIQAVNSSSWVSAFQKLDQYFTDPTGPRRARYQADPNAEKARYTPGPGGVPATYPLVEEYEPDPSRIDPYRPQR